MVDAGSGPGASPGELLDALLKAIGERDLAATLACWGDDGGVSLFGSEVGEAARGSDAVAAFFRKIFARSGSYRFHLPHRDTGARGDLAWMVAEGHVLPPGSSERIPYRLTALFARSPNGWRLTLWSGAEPVER